MKIKINDMAGNVTGNVKWIMKVKSNAPKGVSIPVKFTYEGKTVTVDVTDTEQVIDTPWTTTQGETINVDKISSSATPTTTEEGVTYKVSNLFYDAARAYSSYTGNMGEYLRVSFAMNYNMDDHGISVHYPASDIDGNGTTFKFKIEANTKWEVRVAGISTSDSEGEAISYVTMTVGSQSSKTILSGNTSETLTVKVDKNEESTNMRKFRMLFLSSAGMDQYDFEQLTTKQEGVNGFYTHIYRMYTYIDGDEPLDDERNYNYYPDNYFEDNGRYTRFRKYNNEGFYTIAGSGTSVDNFTARPRIAVSGNTNWNVSATTFSGQGKFVTICDDTGNEKTSGSGTGYVYLSVQPNRSGDIRKFYVTFFPNGVVSSGEHVPYRHEFVQYAMKDEPELIFEDSVWHTYRWEGTVGLHIQSNRSWEIVKCPTWVGLGEEWTDDNHFIHYRKFETLSGSGNDAVQIYFAAAPTGNSLEQIQQRCSEQFTSGCDESVGTVRIGYMTFRTIPQNGEDPVERKLKVMQSLNWAAFTIGAQEGATISIGHGGSPSVYVSDGNSYTFYYETRCAIYLDVTQDGYIAYHNSYLDFRGADEYITLKPMESVPHTLSACLHTKYDSTWEEPVGAVTVSSGTERFYVSVTTNAPWTVSTPSWVTPAISGAEGRANADGTAGDRRIFTCSVSQNTTGIERSDDVVISNNDGDSVSLGITQEG